LGFLESARIFHRKVHGKNYDQDYDYYNDQTRSARSHLWWQVLLFFKGFVFGHSVC